MTEVAVNYAEHFWGDRHLGFSVMYQNMKSGQQSVKELTELLKDRIQLEDECNKMLTKNFNKVSGFSTSVPVAGHSFSAAWTLTKNTLERVLQTRTQLVHALHMVDKETKKYADQLQKAQRSLKQQDTFDAVNLMQTTTTCLQKAKETYATRCTELHKLKLEEQATPKEIGKAEGKIAKAREEYKQYIQKYELVRTDFETKLETAARAFQSHEIEHLLRMKALLANVAKHIEQSHSLSAQIYNEYRLSVEALDPTEVLSQFIAEKATGHQRPPVAVFEEPDLAKEGASPQTSDRRKQSNNTTTNTNNNINNTSITKPAELINNRDTDFALHKSSASESSSSRKSETSARSGVQLDVLSVSVDRNTTIETSALPPCTQAPSKPVVTVTGGSESVPPSQSVQSIGNLISLSPDVEKAPPLPHSEPPQLSPNTVHSNTELDMLHTNNHTITADNSTTGHTTASAGMQLLQALQESPSACTAPASTTTITMTAATPPQQAATSVAEEVRSEPVNEPSAQAPPTGQSQSTSHLGAKLGLFGRSRAKHSSTSKSASTLTPAASVDHLPNSTEEKEHHTLNFFKRRNKKRKDTDQNADAVSQASSRSDEQKTAQNVDDEGYSIRPMADLHGAPKWEGRRSHSNTSDSSDSDDDQTKKLKRLAIKPVEECSTQHNNHSNSEVLRAAVGKLSLAKSSGGSMADLVHRLQSEPAQDHDPWLPSTTNAAGKTVTLMRPALTGDGTANSTFSGFGACGNEPLRPSLTGSTARARPRCNTPTHVFTMPRNNSTDSGSSGPGGERMYRADSLASLQDGMMGLRSGQSMSSLGPADVIPVAMAINETVHAWFTSANSTKAEKVRVFGSVFVSFPVMSLARLTQMQDEDSLDAPVPLSFRLCQASKLNALIPNKQVLSADAKSQFVSCDSYDFAFDPVGLCKYLKREQTNKPNAQFYNIEVLRYELRAPVAAPLLVWSYWKCEQTQSDVRVDYRLNADCTLPSALLNLHFSTAVNGAVNNVMSKPQAEWSSANDHLTWRVTELSPHSQERDGSLKARLTLNKGPSTPAPTNVKFTVSDTTMSGVSVELSTDAYRLSLFRRKLLTGKYFCDANTK